MSSNALSSAKKRRGVSTSNELNNAYNNQQQQPQQQINNGIRTPINMNVLFQAINTRITKLENKINNNNNNNNNNPTVIIDNDEINTRFDIIVSEIAEIKDTIIKLQTFTMEVNKALYDDRISVLSNIDNDVILDENINNIMDDISGN